MTTKPETLTKPFLAIYEERQDQFLVHATPVHDEELFRYELKVLHVMANDPHHGVQYKKGYIFTVGHRKDGDGNQYKTWDLQPIAGWNMIAGEEIHELKIWPEFFEEVQAGRKTHEIRQNDRSFKVGDTLLLREWSKHTETYSGLEVKRKITYISTSETPGVDVGFCVLSLGTVEEPDKEANARETKRPTIVEVLERAEKSGTVIPFIGEDRAPSIPLTGPCIVRLDADGLRKINSYIRDLEIDAAWRDRQVEKAKEEIAQDNLALRTKLDEQSRTIHTILSNRQHLDGCAAMEDARAGFDHIRDCDCIKRFEEVRARANTAEQGVAELTHDNQTLRTRLEDMTAREKAMREARDRNAIGRANEYEALIKNANERSDKLRLKLAQAEDREARTKVLAKEVRAMTNMGIADWTLAGKRIRAILDAIVDGVV